MGKNVKNCRKFVVVTGSLWAVSLTIITQGSHLSSEEELGVFLTAGTLGRTSLPFGVSFLGPFRLRLKIVKMCLVVIQIRVDIQTLKDRDSHWGRQRHKDRQTDRQDHYLLAFISIGSSSSSANNKGFAILDAHSSAVPSSDMSCGGGVGVWRRKQSYSMHVFQWLYIFSNSILTLLPALSLSDKDLKAQIHVLNFNDNKFILDILRWLQVSIAEHHGTVLEDERHEMKYFHWKRL